MPPTIQNGESSNTDKRALKPADRRYLFKCSKLNYRKSKHCFFIPKMLRRYIICPWTVFLNKLKLFTDIPGLN